MDLEGTFLATLVVTKREGSITIETGDHPSAVEAIAALVALVDRLGLCPEKMSPESASVSRLPTHMGNDRVKGSISD